MLHGRGINGTEAWKEVVDVCFEARGGAMEKYEIVGKLGDGTFGTVYKARAKDTGKTA